MRMTSRIGNTLHLLNVLSIATYFSTVLTMGQDSSEMFDKNWLKEGFCLPHTERNFLTTHDLSGYAIGSLALVELGFLHYLGLRANHTAKNNAGFKLAYRLTFWALVGALGHAAGHLIIAHAKRNGIFPQVAERGLDALRHDGWGLRLIKMGPSYFFFWIPLVKAYMLHTSQNKVAIVALVLVCGSLLFPLKFGFAYTQSVLFAGTSLDQLIYLPYADRGVEYALWPTLTLVPSTFLSWIESTGCTSNPLFSKLGHVTYDVVMVLSYLAYFVVCRLYQNAKYRKMWLSAKSW